MAALNVPQGEGAAKVKEIRLVNISGRQYAVGLWWQTPAGGGNLFKAAKKMAEHFAKAGYTHVAFRPKQYGLGCFDTARDKWPKAAFSLAAAIKPTEQKKAYLGLFRLDDEEGHEMWWVCVLLHEYVMAEGDKFFTTREEAEKLRKHLRVQLAGLELAEVTKETTAESLGYLKLILLPQKPLRPLARREIKHLGLKVFCGLFALLATLFAVYWLNDYRANQSDHAIATKKAKLEAIKREMSSNPYKFFKAGWLDKPLVTQAGTQCARAMLAVPLSDKGWVHGSVTCVPAGSLRVDWSYASGASFQQTPRNGVLDDKDSKKAVSDWSLPSLPSRPRPAPPQLLASKEEAKARLSDLTAKLACVLSPPTWDTPESRPLDEGNSVAAPWTRGKFSFTEVPIAALLSTDLFRALDEYPALELASLVVTGNISLTVEGYVYAVTGKQRIQNVPPEVSGALGR